MGHQETGDSYRRYWEMWVIMRYGWEIITENLVRRETITEDIGRCGSSGDNYGRRATITEDIGRYGSSGDNYRRCTCVC